MQLQGRYPGDPRVFHSGVSSRSFPTGIRGQHHAASLYADRYAVRRSAIVASPTRETLPAATNRGSRNRLPSGSRPLAGVQHPLGLIGIVLFWRHQDTKSTQRIRHGCWWGAADGRSVGSCNEVDMVIPSRRSRDRSTRSAAERAETGHRRNGQHDSTGENRAVRIGGTGRDRGNVVGQ